MDAAELALLTEALHKAMTTASGPELDSALVDLGWHELLTELPDVAVPVVFELLGTTGAHASILNDVVRAEAGLPIDRSEVVALPFAGNSWVRWDRTHDAGTTVGGELPIHRVPQGDSIPVTAGRRALGWWLLGTGKSMLDLARTHAVERAQFGKPVAAFQAVRHRLAETLVALEGAEATLLAADDDLGALLAKAAAGRAALTAAKHCQQVLGGIGFTAEHDFHRHLERAMILDGILGNARELTQEAGRLLRTTGHAPRLTQL
ncbi:acyl-CoA dehydrogenase family protein [Nocardia callitridis]|uniref:Acyl-CoA dehydrogenase family protein n=1 Tax=Nocardia callitridis TaxID=648753 RepID=A0ABP9K670_9NOCA